jgi:hypothetical protein
VKTEIADLVHRALNNDKARARYLIDRLHNVESNEDPSRQHEYNDLFMQLVALADIEGQISLPPDLRAQLITRDIANVTGSYAKMFSTPDEIHKETIDMFVRAQQSLFNSAKTEVSRKGQYERDTDENHVRMTRKLWALFRTARVYEFGPHQVLPIMEALWNGVKGDGSMLQKMANAEMDAIAEGDEDRQKTLFRGAKKALDEQGWPELPFDVCYFGYGTGISIPDTMLWAYNMSPQRYQEVDVSGHLITSRGEVFEVLKAFDLTHMEMHTIMFQQQRDVSGWEMPFTVTPWLVIELVSQINDAQHIIHHRGLGYKMMYKKACKDAGLKIKKALPPPYYIVPVCDKYTERKDGGEHREVDWSHRWDSEAHWAHRIRRGPLPVPPEVALMLDKETKSGAKWQIWTTGDVPSWVNRLFAKRGMKPKQAGEWIAVLRYRVSASIKGPADKPYIPASRKLIKVTDSADHTNPG